MKRDKSRSKSLFRDIVDRFIRNKVALIAFIILSIIILTAIFADLITSYNQAIQQNIKARLQGPSPEHWLGTDGFGRDVFARIIHGTRISLIIGVMTTLIALLFACILGATAGFLGGEVDNIVMRIIDILMCIPMSLLIMSIVAALGANLRNLIIAMSIGQVAAFTRIVRSVVLNLRDADFIEAGRACGASTPYLIARHILPNAIGPIIVQGTMNIAAAILSASGFSYIGLGVQPPQPEWGVMLSEGRDFLRTNPMLCIFPGLAIVFTALSFNLVGDGLRDALDPRLKD